MQRIATFTKVHGDKNVTKIHGNGNIEVIMNGVVNAELMRQRELEQQQFNNAMKEHEMEMRCMNIIMNGIKNQRDDMRKERYSNLIERLSKECHKEIIDKVKYAFFYCFACLLTWAEMLGLLEYVYDEKE